MCAQYFKAVDNTSLECHSLPPVCVLRGTVATTAAHPADPAQPSARAQRAGTVTGDALCDCLPLVSLPPPPSPPTSA